MKRISDIDQWLPTSADELKQKGWDVPDVILFSGDAYIDHPSFGAAVIGRVLEDEGLKVAIVPQPNWRDDLRDFRKLGKPRLFFGVTAGNMDSMVNHYTAARRLRFDDAYTPGGKAGFRPDYPTIVYTRILKRLFPEVPVVAGGIEASMRRLTHYDYWKDKLEPSIIMSSGADMLIYGIGEQAVRELVKSLKSGLPFSGLKTIPQTVILAEGTEDPEPYPGRSDIILNSYEDCIGSKKAFAANFIAFETESNRIEAARLIEPVSGKRVMVNPPFPPMDVSEADRSYALPFTYRPHPRYDKKGPVPAYEMIKFSVNIHRGCFGGCSFCAIAAHQGKQILSRSEESIINEIRKISRLPGFSGYITDLGGPSANMYKMQGIKPELCRRCSRPSCIWPSVCKNLDTDHSSLLKLYRKVKDLPGLKKAFIGSGIRYDLLFPEWNPRAGRQEAAYLKELLNDHIPGRLKVAPEHTEKHVLGLMRKAPFSLFGRLKSEFDNHNKRSEVKYELIPYFISSHPGCTDDDMRKLASEVKSMGVRPEQVQDFTPTPMTLSTLIYYTGFDPYSGRKVFVARKQEEKKRQKDFFFWYKTGSRHQNGRKRKR